MKLFSILACVSMVLFIVAFPSPSSAVESQISKPIRALHFVVLGISLHEAEKLADRAADNGFNTIIPNILWGASVKLKTFPWPVRVKPWSRNQLVAFVKYARGKGLRVVPQFPTLSKQRNLLGKHRPDLMYNRATYNPNKKEVYRLIYPMLGELISLVHPKAILIGHDEVVGWSRSNYVKGFLRPGEKMLPARLFLRDTLKLHKFLKSRGVATWMWGDMLISPREFPSMEPHSLHGGMPGYGKQLRMRLPKDIVICDWHYSGDQRDFPSLAAFRQEGFRVLGATWKNENTIRNFSRYAAKHGAEGMIATTWSYVQRKDWKVVDRIIKFSGKTFLKDFPGAN